MSHMTTIVWIFPYFLLLQRNENEPEDSAPRRSELLKFITGNPPQAKRIWRNAVEQHTFFR